MADRVGQVRVGARPRPRRARPATRSGGVGGAHRVLDPPGARPARTPPRSPPAASSTGSTPGSASAGGRARDAPAREPRRPGRARPREPRARAQPPHARALRAADRRPRVPRARRRLRASPSPSSTATSPPTSTPTASTARPRRTTTRSRCARSSARARTPAATGRAAGRLRRAGRPRVRVPRPLPPPRRDDPGAVGRRHRRLRRCCSPAATSCSGPGRGDRGRASFPDGGYHVQRSGWDPEARFLIFDCGPLGDGGHGHYDLLSIEAHGDGRPLVLDPGPRQLLRGAAEPAPLVPRHGRAQHGLRRRPRPDAVHARRARRGRRRRAPPRPRSRGLDVLAGEVAQPALRGRPPAPRSRSSTSATGSIEDELGASATHRYDLRFHLAAGAQDAARVEAAPCSRPALALRIAAPADPLEPGWIAPRYGVVRRRAGGQRRRPRRATRRFVDARLAP